MTLLSRPRQTANDTSGETQSCLFRSKVALDADSIRSGVIDVNRNYNKSNSLPVMHRMSIICMMNH